MTTVTKKNMKKILFFIFYFRLSSYLFSVVKEKRKLTKFTENCAQFEEEESVLLQTCFCYLNKKRKLIGVLGNCFLIRGNVILSLEAF